MDNVLSKALREFTTGPLNQLIVNLGGQDGPKWESELKKFLRKEPCWVDARAVQASTVEPRTPLLEFVSTVVIPATTEKFVAKEKFVFGTETTPKFHGIGVNFRAWFLNGDGKIEDPISNQTLHCSKLRKKSRHNPIIRELGGKDKSETTLSEMYFLMEKQKNGESGALLKTGRANIFFIKDVAGVLRAVGVRYFCGFWDVGANLIKDPVRWDAGDQVFSRKPTHALAIAATI